ncbi:MAG TPA: MarR family transcriptional regulator [Candidatus Kryptonia bacterium]
MRKKDLMRELIVGTRENSIGAVLFHQAAGQILGLNVSDMKCLDAIVIRGPSTPSRLASITGLTTGATTTMIDRLEKAGLVERQRNPDDRRGTVVVLSKQAAKKLPPLFDSMSRAMERLASGYTENELKLLSEYFRKLAVIWKEERYKLLARVQDR